MLLRPVTAVDAGGRLGCDEETLRLTGSHHRAHGLAELERWYATRAEHDDRLDLSIIERATGQWAGEAIYRRPT